MIVAQVSRRAPFRFFAHEVAPHGPHDVQLVGMGMVHGLLQYPVLTGEVARI